MLGILIDTALLRATCSLLARQNLKDEWFRFFISAALLIAAGTVLLLARATLPASLAV